MPEDNETSELSLNRAIDEIGVSRHSDVGLASGDPSQEQLRASLGQFATGVTIVTTSDGAGEKVGLTVNSFNSVSLDPPLILWSIAHTSYGIDVFEKAEHFCVNVLCADQVDLAHLFAQASEDKFNGLAVSYGLESVPLINGCLAHFECATEARYPGGDHLILLGRVMRYKSADREPLLFHAGSYFDLAHNEIELKRKKTTKT